MNIFNKRVMHAKLFYGFNEYSTTHSHSKFLKQFKRTKHLNKSSCQKSDFNFIFIVFPHCLQKI